MIAWTRCVGLCVLAGAAFVLPHLHADTVLFKDSSGSGSEVIPGYYFDFSTCAAQQYYTGTTIPIPQLPAGSCQPFEGYPYTVSSNSIPGTVYIGDTAGYVSDKIDTVISPPGPNTWSCTVGGIFKNPCPGVTGVNFVFTYGLDIGLPVTCASVGGCQFTGSGSIQTLGVINWANGELPANGSSTTLEFQAVTTSLISFDGGSSAAPAVLPTGQPVGALTGTIGGFGSQEYYSFMWPGGTFIATASVSDAPSSLASYSFSEGILGRCDNGSSVALTSSNSFKNTLQISNLAAGAYCIGIDANNPNDPPFTLTFATPVTGFTVPEVSGLVFVPAGWWMIGLIGRRRRPH